MNNKIHSLALLVNLGIYGVALPAMAEDQTDSVAVSHDGPGKHPDPDRR